MLRSLNYLLTAERHLDSWTLQRHLITEKLWQLSLLYLAAKISAGTVSDIPCFLKRFPCNLHKLLLQPGSIMDGPKEILFCKLIVPDHSKIAQQVLFFSKQHNLFDLMYHFENELVSIFAEKTNKFL